MAWFTGILCALGCLCLFYMWGLKQLNKVSTTSLYYFAWNAAGIVLLSAATLIDSYTQALDGWVVQIVFFIVSSWATMWFFRRKR
ncbi:MAG TPA: hypothetical protein VIN59_09905 [Alphaproteobacteria bacterium]